MSAGPYLLGDEDPELRRLADQHLVWSETTLQGWRRAGLTAGGRVLDVGCGPGFTTVELARLVGPEGSVVGLDPSTRFNEYLAGQARAIGLENLEVRTGAIEDLEEAGAYDLVNVRWVLCFLPDPAAAIARLARSLKPGGRLVTLDYFNYRAFALAPPIPSMKAVVQAVFDSWADSGGSLEVQGSTPAACEAAGLEVTEIEQVSGTARPGTPRFAWPEAFLRGYLPKLVDQGLLDGEICHSFLAEWDARKAEPGTFLYLPPLLRVIAKKP